MTSEAIPLDVVSGMVPVPGGVRAATAEPGGPVAGADLAARIADHPCYSADAHQYYARMHVPVAPGCNIQCNYCNRKFDCSNESRPGVTSALLTPERALAKVRRVANGVKQLRVVGVAGPGEPLANASRTLRTLDLIRQYCPDLRLCLSTNGLNLTDHVDRIADLGIDHVTITINMVDPEVGALIYPWIAYRGRRYSGVEAARILSERQLAGLAALAERSILCKVNSVVIPGVNDEHIVEVARTVKRLGAILHNVMPLVSKPEHGTYFGLTGQREPTAQELQDLRDRCEGTAGGSLTVMRHCRQCRADAVGMLGEDRSNEFGADPDGGLDANHEEYDLAGRAQARAEIERWRAEVAAARMACGITTTSGPAAHGPAVGASAGSGPAGSGPVAGGVGGGRPGAEDGGSARPRSTVLVAVATTGGGVVNQHFGRAKEFWIYEAGDRWVRLVGIRKVPTSCGGPASCGQQIEPLTAAVTLLSDCAAVLCNKIGPQPHGALTAAGIEPVEISDVIEQAVAQAGARLTGARAGVPLSDGPSGEQAGDGPTGQRAGARPGGQLSGRHLVGKQVSRS